MDFHDLYRRYAGDVRRFALYLSGNAALADDITSETFLRAWSSVERIREATVKAYLFAIVRNLYLLELRRSSRHVELESFDDVLQSTEGSQEDRLDRQTALAMLLRALRTLPEVDRAALLMRTQNGMSYEDIAEALQLSLSSAKVKVHRARLKLASLLSRTVMP
jgi:RNA polymerase sigma-70 factor (ECF subfamily)